MGADGQGTVVTILPDSVYRQVAEEYNTYNQYTAANGVQNDTAQQTAESYDAFTRYRAAQGIEPVRPLEVTVAGASATGGTKLELHLHIEAGAPPETVDTWQDYVRSGEAEAFILEVMEKAEAETRRRSMV